MSKKSLRIILPTLALLTGLVAGAFASQPSPAVAQSTGEQCVAQAENVMGCTPPNPECYVLGPCRWICP